VIPLSANTGIAALHGKNVTVDAFLAACPGTAKNHKDAASIRTTHPIPASCGVYYFEVKVVSKGRDGQVIVCFRKLEYTVDSFINYVSYQQSCKSKIHGHCRDL